MFRKICALAIVGTVSAKIQVDIDDEKIGGVATELKEWAEFTAQSDEAQAIATGLNHFINHAQWEIASHQKDLLKPFIKDLKIYMKYFNPDMKKCNADAFIQCSVTDHVVSYWDAITTQCAYDNGCMLKWDEVSEDEQIKQADKFLASVDEAKFAFNKLRDAINADFMNIAVENIDNASILAESVREETAHVLKQWGCDIPCVDSCTENLEVFSSGVCSTCKCPQAISYKHTPNVATIKPAQAAALMKATDPKGWKSLRTTSTCTIPELCDENGVFVGAGSDPCDKSGGLYNIPELCDENGNFVGKSIVPASQILVCDIPELCDENGHFVGIRVEDTPKPTCDIPELCDENGVFIGRVTATCTIPELCDENGVFVGKSITVAEAARLSLVFDFGKDIVMPTPGKIETGTVKQQEKISTPDIGMFYGIGLKQSRPQSLIFLSEHQHLFKTKKSEDMFARTFGMIGQTLYMGAVGTILLSMALVGYTKSKSLSASDEDSEHFRVEASV